MEDRKKRYYRIINNVWDFMKNHLDQEQDWEQFCSDMKNSVNEQNEADQKIVREMLVAFENDLAERNK